MWVEYMEGIQRVYQTGIGYAKARYVPDRASLLVSVVSIVLYTVMVFLVTEWLLRGRVGRWLYLGTVVMVVSMIYRGTVTDKDLIPL